MYQKLQSGYELYMSNLKNEKDDITKFKLDVQNNKVADQILKEKGAFQTVDDHNVQNLNINDCVEGFVVDKNNQNNIKISDKFQISNVKWNTPNLEEMIFPWLFPYGIGGFDLNDKTNHKLTFNK